MKLTLVTHLVRRRSQRSAERVALRERRRLARDLHDGLGQDLYATSLALATLRNQVPDGVQPQIEQLLVRQEAMIERTRQLVDDRTEEVPGRMPLDEFLQALTYVVHSELGGDPLIEITSETPGELPRKLLHHGAFALREMISNAVRHSGASMIVTMIDLDRAHMTLSVIDDGCGHIGDVTAGYGLNNLTQRARRCGGRFSWHAPEGAGTTARWRVPLRCRRATPLASLLNSAR